MKKTNFFSIPLIILAIFVLSVIYWIYLSLTTQMVMVFDALGYQKLGNLLYHQGFLAYIKDGPNREPIYPLLVSLAMQVSDLTGLGYTKIMAFFGVIILLITQILLFIILRLLKIRTAICAVVLTYFAISPGLLNTAFSLYSEIASYPFILTIVLISGLLLQASQDKNSQRNFWLSALLGFFFALTTLVKAIFECIAPIYLIAFFIIMRSSASNNLKKPTPYIIYTLIALSCFYIPITGYKWLNKNLNGYFVVTDRGSWALYGNTARRMEPLNFRKFLCALSYVPGEGVCNSLFTKPECDFWSFRRSDELGYGIAAELSARHKSPDETNTMMLKLSFEKAKENPLQYGLLASLEGLKLFFWESTKVGFVVYPSWLDRIYDTTWFKNYLRLIIAIITLISFIYCLFITFKSKDPLMLSISLLLILYIGLYSLFFILTRYALPIAPLFLMTIGYSFNQILSKK